MASIATTLLRLPLLLRLLCIAFFFLFSSLHAACTTAALDDVRSSSSGEIHLDPAAAGGFGTQEQEEEEEETLRFPDNEMTTLQLLKPGAGHSRLELNRMTLEKLASIEEPIAFVSVVGPYHGGKSFLLNVLLNSTQGFSVSAVPDPETQGIWIRIVPKEQLQGADNSRIILMDTEGFYGEGATRSYDARIFAIATLVSSHLIYNTLRTIGDTQSVTALADLAKQAQVFNLQNWLHSAEASPGQEEHPAAVYTDSFLLLKMLDFPPLTWVVQGFDMDLSSQAPMDHLHRYLEALAHTGDRTLDTLFTQGISCHTIRTPTDLNKLREQVGGEGLAAHTELYPILHPNYLSDVDKLRDTIFKKLKAKGAGKFTGKSVAELLPLLVHYVNEDFPLNAERKLRDVLSELVIDGAFSGGTQYFQALMQNPTLPPRAQGKEVDLAFVEQVRKDSISALASTAFTTRELEDIMTSAEKKAIDYCKQRCVGVPPTQESSTCIVQLGTKIARMKVKYREENERRVKQVLVELGEDLRIAAEKEVEGLPLPMRDTEIERFCKQAKSSVLQRYEALVGPHRHSNLYQEARSQIISLVQIKCDKVLLMNSEKITRLLSSGKQAYQDAYGRIVQAQVLGATKGDMAKEGGGEVDVDNEKHSQKPIPPWSLVDIHKAGIKAGQEAFERNIKAAGLPWVGPGDDRYDFQLYSCLQWSKKQFDKLQHSIL
ncbi:hypothetical protein CY35_05G143000 [Sphagnum magellanicum]|nr:hypothetical protein CY35_05G143000 [Sphagnum magellanicum]